MATALGAPVRGQERLQRHQKLWANLRAVAQGGPRGSIEARQPQSIHDRGCGHRAEPQDPPQLRLLVHGQGTRYRLVRGRCHVITGRDRCRRGGTVQPLPDAARRPRKNLLQGIPALGLFLLQGPLV